MNLKEMQKEILQNKINKGFNITDINKEFCLLYGEVSEAYDAYRKNKDDLGEELADIAIYLLGISEILGKDLEEEIINKIENKDNELIDDFVSIITSFCGRIYGRKRKTKTQEIIDQLELTPERTKDETSV